MKTIEDIRGEFQSTTITVDTSSPVGKFVKDLVKILAEYETAAKEQKRLDNISAAKLYGTKIGRKSKMDEVNIQEAILLKEEGYTNNEIAKEFKIGRSTLLRYLAEYRAL